MSRSFTSGTLCLGLLGLIAAPVYAQPADVPAEMVVRQGDTIEWAAVDGTPHKVRFGASGTTSPAEASTILEFSPALTPGPVGDSKQAGDGPLLTAKVKNDAPVGKTFVFACGVHTGNRMLSLPITIAARGSQPARTHQILGMSDVHWRLHVDVTP